MEQERVYDHANETLGSYHRIERSNDPISNPCLDVATEERVESVHLRLKKDMCQYVAFESSKRVDLESATEQQAH